MGTMFSDLQAVVHAWQPMQRVWSMTFAHCTRSVRDVCSSIMSVGGGEYIRDGRLSQYLFRREMVPEVTSVARDNVRLRPSAHTDGTDFIAVAPRSKNSLTLLKPTRYIGFGPKKRPLPQTISVSVLARNLSRFPKFIAARQ